MSVNECVLMNDRGRTVAMGSRDQITRCLKHHVDDGHRIPLP